jgi:hypothetical protein
LNTALTLATELGVLQTYVPELKEHQKICPNIFLANFDPDLQIQLLKHLKSAPVDRLRQHEFMDHPQTKIFTPFNEDGAFVCGQ